MPAVKDEVLISWKQIAAYFEVSEVTMKRRHRENPLPIYRLGEGGPVRADVSDLEKWKEKLKK